MDPVTFLGMLAGMLTTVSFLPQVYMTWKTRSARDISVLMYLIFTIGLILWLIYGVIIHSWPVVIANTVTLFLTTAMLLMKVAFSRRRQD